MVAFREKTKGRETLSSDIQPDIEIPRPPPLRGLLLSGKGSLRLRRPPPYCLPAMLRSLPPLWQNLLRRLSSERLPQVQSFGSSLNALKGRQLESLTSRPEKQSRRCLRLRIARPQEKTVKTGGPDPDARPFAQIAAPARRAASTISAHASASERTS